MGLDMYLNKHTYVQQWEHQKHEEKYNVEVTKGGEPTNINPKKIKYIVEEAGYWRKANQIHQWFVENVQKGVDDCGNYYVSTDDLEKLLEVCIAVKLNHEQADTLLPSASGFFFGGTEYDEWYFNGIDNTIEILKEALADESDSSYYYSSSW
jgi:hypothetical protein